MFKNEIPKFSEILEKWDQINEEFNPLSSREQMRMGQQRMNQRNPNNSGDHKNFVETFSKFCAKLFVAQKDTVTYMDGSKDELDVEEVKKELSEFIDNYRSKNQLLSHLLNIGNLTTGAIVTGMSRVVRVVAQEGDYTGAKDICEAWEDVINKEVKDTTLKNMLKLDEEIIKNEISLHY